MAAGSVQITIPSRVEGGASKPTHFSNDLFEGKILFLAADAMGAAQQFAVFASSPPKAVLDRLKTQCAQPLQEAQFDLSHAINDEKRSIEKILSLQHAGVALLWTLTVSVSIGLSNYFFPLLLSTYGGEYVVAVLGAMVGLAGIIFSVTFAVRYRAWHMCCHSCHCRLL